MKKAGKVAGKGSAPARPAMPPMPAPTSPRRARRSWLAVVGEWRNWRLPVKVATVLFVPALAAISLGALQIQRDVARTQDLTTVQNLIEFRGALIPLMTGLQDERWLATRKLGSNLPVDSNELSRVQAQVDQDAANIRDTGSRLLDPNSAAGTRFQELVGQFAGLAALHKQSLGTSDVAVTTVVSSYDQLIGFVLDLEQSLATQFSDVALAGTATALDDIDSANEQVRQMEAVVTVAMYRGRLLDTELATAHTADVLLGDRRNNYQVVATADQLALFQDSDVVNALNAREQLAQSVLANGLAMAVLGSATQSAQSQSGQSHSAQSPPAQPTPSQSPPAQPTPTHSPSAQSPTAQSPSAQSPSAQSPSAPPTPAGPLGVDPKDWISASDAATTRLVTVRDKLFDELRAVSAGLYDDARRTAVIEAIVLSVVMLLAIGIGVIVGRHLLRSLKILRGTALEVAERQLPEMVASLDRGELTGADIAPVPVHTHEELGQLARAFDAVHGQAVRSALGQAALRGKMRSTFVNLSRRSQGLVERQLRLMEQLERNEEDPQQLANLFKLDHLATRMRRNNENLMVLSGNDPVHRSGRPLPLADVLRAAISEIEQYQRVVVRSAPVVDVLGHASGDLVRLIAELLDNGTSFAPPETNVQVGAAMQSDGSVRIAIQDDGIGMAGAELAEANRRLTSADVAEVPISRQMGLYVIGRLAHRHGIIVKLTGLPDSGLLAVVLVPADLVRQGHGPAELSAPSTPPAAHNTPIERASVNGQNTHADRAGTKAKAPTIEPSAPVRGLIAGEIAPESWIPADNIGFTWFMAPGSEPEPYRDPGPALQIEFTSVGLPRRVPRAHAVPYLVEPPPKRLAPAQAATNTPSTGAAAPIAGPRRNPARTRGFLSDYQSGIRQAGRHSHATPAWDYESGEPAVSTPDRQETDV